MSKGLSRDTKQRTKSDARRPERELGLKAARADSVQDEKDWKAEIRMDLCRTF